MILHRALSAVRRVPVALAVLLAAAIGVRVALWAAYQPAVLNLYDTVIYVDAARDQLFFDPARTAGYPMFMRGLHAISSDLEVMIAAQHLIGIITGLLLYATVRRLGTPSWVAVVAAAAVLLPVDQVVLEHAIMAETVFTFGVVVVLYAGVRALDAPRDVLGRMTTRHLWLVVAGVSLALAAWARGVAAPVIPFLALWVALAIPGGWWARIGRAAVAAGSATAVLLAYFALNAAETGEFALSRSSGWALYARTAPFADCDQFEPPAGTTGLCQTRPAEDRRGPDFYGWEKGSPARQLFGPPPAGNEQLSAFAVEAIKHQPLDYTRAVFIDTVKYFVTPFGPPRAYAGPGYESLDVGRRAPGVEEALMRSIRTYYPDEKRAIGGGVGTVGEVQDWLRVHPPLLLVAVVLALIGLELARGRLRTGLWLLLGMGLLLLIVPSATAIYNARYAVPASGPLVAAGAIGLWLAGTRLIEARRAKPRAASQSTS